jgi:aromatic ring-opening dioxygenase LigB subunit
MPDIQTAFAVCHAPILVDGIGSDSDFATASASRTAYRQVAAQIAGLNPELLVVATPHGRIYADSMHISSGSGADGDWLDFGRDPQRYHVSFDQPFVTALYEEATAAGIPCDTGNDSRLDHGTLVPLHFISQAWQDQAQAQAHAQAPAAADAAHPATLPLLVRISISLLGDEAHYRMGQCVNAVARQLGRNAVFIASGDLSHRLKADGPYGFNPAGPVFDQRLTQAFSAADLGALSTFDNTIRDEAGECGLNSFIMMSGIFDDSPVSSELYSYEGPWGVGYAMARFDRQAQDPAATGT